MTSKDLKQLTPGNQLFVGLTYPRSSIVDKHISLWQRITDIPKEQYIVMKMQHEFSDACDVLFFTNKSAMQKFEIWWSAYALRFPKDQVYQNAIPMPQEGEHLSGYPLMHKGNNKNMALSMLLRVHTDQWQWIVEHITEPVLYTKEFWLFSNEADMVMFKLRDKRLGDEEKEEVEDYDMPF